MERRYYYTLFMFLALGVFLLTRRLMPKVPELAAVPWWKKGSLALGALVGGALGGKLPFVLAGGADWWSSTAWLSDGKTITTALLGGYLGVEITKLMLDVHAKTGDSFALPLALALAVGRFGCFFYGCCYGAPTDMPWGVDFGDGLRRHPTQIYEVAFHLCMAVLLWRLMATAVLRYQRLKLYFIAYGIFRFLTEFVRPEPRGELGLTFYQWVALLLIAVMSLLWYVDARWKARQVQPALG